MILNGAYSSWRKADQLLLSWLFSTLSPAIMGQVTDCPTSFATWSTLERLYSQKSMAKVLQLKHQLQNTKKGSLSISEYFLKIKTLGDELRAAGQTITEFDLVLSLMSGLGHEYDLVVILASSQHQSMSLEDAQYMLMVHEQRLEQLNYVSSIDPSGASTNFMANAVNNSYSREGSNTRGTGQHRGGRGRGRKWHSNNRLSCQLCNKNGHSALQCYRRFHQTWTGVPPPQQQPYQAPPQQQPSTPRNSPQQAYYTQNTAYYASLESVQDQSWYMDSGATNHVTSDLGNLSLKSEYRGDNRLTVGNGQQIGNEEGTASRST
ncbi:hypothetical protein ACOSQ3_031038 [Xanthoceras sorbifolium]